MPAVAAGRFVPPFAMERMTWIKPSFNWMMYRSGFARKPGQEVVLAIHITREGFEVAAPFRPILESLGPQGARAVREQVVEALGSYERDGTIEMNAKLVRASATR